MYSPGQHVSMISIDFKHKGRLPAESEAMLPDSVGRSKVSMVRKPG